MPYVNLQITKAPNREQKKEIVADFTATLVRVLGKKPEHTHIVIQEIDDVDWGFAGVLTDTYRRRTKREWHCGRRRGASALPGDRSRTASRPPQR